jgi:hypothetical protein
MRRIAPYIVLAAACGAAGAREASPGPPEKRRHHLFNPTPPGLMRDLSTDRPDATESPHTVDAGHVQVEASFLEYTRDGSADAYSVAPTNFKIGLTHNVDVQFVVQPYLDEDGGAEGFGDSQIRLKINLWGNDGGDTALAIMPFVQFPTGDDDVSSDKFEGGLIVPLAVALPNEFGLTVMAEFDVVRNSDDDGYRVDFVHTAALGRAIVGPLGGFVEYIGVLPFEGGEDYLAFASCGLTYGIGENVQLDAAARFGLVDEAEDVTLLAGISFRF